eukprot:400700-Pyramimonas_sp.AAC.1
MFKSEAGHRILLTVVTWRHRYLAVGKRAPACRGGEGAEEHRFACPDQGGGEVHTEKRQAEEEEEGRGMWRG